MEFLQKITHHMPWFIRDPAVALIGTECYTNLVYNVDFADVRCVQYAISKVLGLGIVVGGGIVKVPQIVKILSSKSGRGLSLSSYILDTAGLILVVGYNYRKRFPFSTYGENCFLLIQNLVIMALLLAFSRKPQGPAMSLVAVIVPIGLLSVLTSESFVPVSALRTFVALSIPLALASKFPQILENHKRQSTGQLSAFLVFNSLAGCLARVFTTATETGDRTLWWSFVFAAALNGALALQMGMFWKNSDPEDKLTDRSSYNLDNAYGSSTAGKGAADVRARGVAPGVAGGEPRPASPRLVSSGRSPRAYVRKAD